MTTKKDKIVILNRQRGSIKRQIRPIAEYVSDINEEGINIIECEIKLENIKRIVKKLEDLKMEYYGLVENDDELKPLEEEVEELEKECEKIEVSLRTFILTSNKKENKQNVTSNSSTDNNSLSNSDKLNIRLPEIYLKKFSGLYQHWYEFKDQFVTLIDKNEKLSDTQKMYYLKSTLSGPALDIVTLHDTYTSLFQALIDRFENKRVIVNSHLAEILSLETCPQESAKHLRTILDSLQKNIRALKTIGLDIDTFAETLIIHIVSKKLSKETIKNFELNVASNALPSYHAFIEFLQKRCLILENLQTNTSQFAVISTLNKQKYSNEQSNNNKKKLLFTNTANKDRQFIKMFSLLQ